MDVISEEQFRRNRDCRAGWDSYAGHRGNVTAALVQNRTTEQGRLCVLGAGNCNDLDLKRLRQSFAEVHLVDLDEEALAVGCQTQRVESDPGIVCYPGVDVSGILPQICSWRPESPVSREDVKNVVQVAQQPNSLGLVSSSYDVVASAGLLTQLIDEIGLTLGTKHPEFLSLMTSVRLRHLQLLLELARPGGISWLFTEVVSSLTCPELLVSTSTTLMPLLTRCINQGNFFSGCNPAVLNQLYSQDPTLRSAVQKVFVSPPWLWKFVYRTYAVCAIGAMKKGD